MPDTLAFFNDSGATEYYRQMVDIKAWADNREWQVNICRLAWPVLRPNQGSSCRKRGKEGK